MKIEVSSQGDIFYKKTYHETYIDAPGALNSIIVRGIARGNIFDDDAEVLACRFPMPICPDSSPNAGLRYAAAYGALIL